MFRKVWKTLNAPINFDSAAAGQWIGIVIFGTVAYKAKEWIPPGAQDYFVPCLSVFVAGIVGAVVEKERAYKVDVWKGKAVQVNPDSGREPHYEVILRKTKPNWKRRPVYYCLRPFPATLGKIDATTGSVSVTPRGMISVRSHNKYKWNIGTNDSITGKAAKHVRRMRDSLTWNGKELNQKERDQLETINRMISSGLKLEEKGK